MNLPTASPGAASSAALSPAPASASSPGQASWASRPLIALIRVYQRLLSPLLGNVCRFEPSCSRYAVACLETHGALRGSLLSLVRLCKCHPFHPGGFDPPPLGSPARASDRASQRPRSPSPSNPV